MDYIKYIELGFERTDLNDTVVFRETGYGGFCLWKQVNKKIAISVTSEALNEPSLYIKKRDGEDNYHIVKIKPEMVLDLLHNPKKEKIENYINYPSAC